MCTNSDALAQNELDVFRFSRDSPILTVRATGMGGAYGALGADLSSAGLNPAGLGMYRRSDMSAAISINSKNVKANHNLIITSASKAQTDIGSFGVALTTPSVNPDMPFVTIAYNFQKRAIYSGVIDLDRSNLNSSLLGVFHNNVEGTTDYTNLDNGSAFTFSSSLAWYAYLLDPNGSQIDSYTTPFDTNEEVEYSYFMEEDGTKDEHQFSIGCTLNEIISVGATVSSSNISYSQQSTHSETVLDPDSDVASWEYTNTLFIDGSGYNLKLGAIANADWLKLGLAWHSPTRFNLVDTYWNSVNSYFKDGSFYNPESPTGSYEYYLRTPSKLILSSAVIVDKYVIITADYETIDLSKGSLEGIDNWSIPYGFDAENAAVETSYTRTHEARIGLEARINKYWRARIGSGLTTSPFTNEAGVEANPARTRFSLGAEYRLEEKYLGIAWTGSWYDEDLYVTDPSLQGTPINLSVSQTMLVIGGGIRF
ncbi:MAG: hypothetical protein CL823_07585 [Crocinitomicaceae bacterium]|nr:hypothetical protein [Crocinitomicaceae bacterium]